MTEAAPRGISAIRRFLSGGARAERCDFCNAAIGGFHPHLFEPRDRRLSCACPACATLFPSSADTKYRRVASRAERLEGVDLTEDDWQSLGIPVGLSYVTRSLVHDAVFAVHPNRGGATETRVSVAAWGGLVSKHPKLGRVAPELEGVLLSSIGRASFAAVLSVDLFHAFVGQLRERSDWSERAILAALAHVEVRHA